MGTDSKRWSSIDGMKKWLGSNTKNTPSNLAQVLVYIRIPGQVVHMLDLLLCIMCDHLPVFLYVEIAHRDHSAEMFLG